MMIWTKTAVALLRDAGAKAEAMNMTEVHPLHLLWAAAGHTGLEALRRGQSDHRQARLRFQIERDLNKLLDHNRFGAEPVVECATPGPRLQRLLLRAADLAAAAPGQRAIGQAELLAALAQDDPRAGRLSGSGAGELNATA